MVVCAALSLYLFEAGQLGRRLLIGLVAFSCVLVFYGWGVRTSMVAALAFGLVYLGQRSRVLPLAVLLVVAFGLALALVPLLFAAEAPGKEILHPVAVVIFGGLISSTLLDVLLTPLLFRRYGGPALASIDSDPSQGDTP